MRPAIANKQSKFWEWRYHALVTKQIVTPRQYRAKCSATNKVADDSADRHDSPSEACLTTTASTTTNDTTPADLQNEPSADDIIQHIVECGKNLRKKTGSADDLKQALTAFASLSQKTTNKDVWEPSQLASVLHSQSWHCMDIKSIDIVFERLNGTTKVINGGSVVKIIHSMARLGLNTTTTTTRKKSLQYHHHDHPQNGAKRFLQRVSNSLSSKVNTDTSLPTLSDYKLQKICLLCWALQCLHVDNTAWLYNLLQHIEDNEVYMEELAQLDVRSYCQLLSAVSYYNITSSEKVLDRIAEVLVKRGPFGIDQRALSNILSYYANIWWRHCDEYGSSRVEVQQRMKKYMSQRKERSDLISNLILKWSLDYIPTIPAIGLTQIMWSASRLGLQSTQYFEIIEDRAVVLAANHEMKGHDVSLLAWSFATAGYDSPRLYSALADAAVKLLMINDDNDNDSRSLSLQSLSHLAFGYGHVNMFHEELFNAIAIKAEPLLSESKPQVMANIAFGCSMVGFYPTGFFTKWREELSRRGLGSFNVYELRQLHQVEVALRLEAPHIQLPVSSSEDSASVFEDLYQAGRRSALTRSNWQDRFDNNTATGRQANITKLQKDVYAALSQLGINAELEYDKEEYSLDIALPAFKLAIEVDGPVHYTYNTNRHLGTSVLKRRLLKCLSWDVITIPYYEWRTLAGEDKKIDYLRMKFKQAGYQIEELAMQTTTNQVADMKKKEMQGIDIAPAADDYAEDSEVIGTVTCPEVVQQRASRLIMKQYKDGKLSKMSTVTKQALLKSKKKKDTDTDNNNNDGD